MNKDEIFDSRRRDSSRRIDDLRKVLSATLAAIPEIHEQPQVCIYATGSLARLEANPHSDLDAFFFLTGCQKDTPLGRIRNVRILNAVIDAAQLNSFPDFSNDGEFLEFLHIDDVLSHIGSREDDYFNALTARMLLILESRYLYNEVQFQQMRQAVIERYFVDFHDHPGEFRPIFLLNDVLRFWRTLCINYEHSREWRTSDPEKRAKGHLSNLKLRFSRLSICFSFIATLLSKGGALSPADVEHVAAMSPLERLNALRDFSTVARTCVDTLELEYAWFLEAVSREKSIVLDWISTEHDREQAFDHSQRFVGAMYGLVREIAEPHGYLRYLVI